MVQYVVTQQCQITTSCLRQIEPSLSVLFYLHSFAFVFILFLKLYHTFFPTLFLISWVLPWVKSQVDFCSQRPGGVRSSGALVDSWAWVRHIWWRQNQLVTRCLIARGRNTSHSSTNAPFVTENVDPKLISPIEN